METQHTPQVTTPVLHADHGLQQLGQAIISTVEVEKIICFSSFSHHTVSKSCFEEIADVNSATKNRYALLVIPLVSQAPSGAIVQQQVERVAGPTAEVTALVHTMEEVNAALRNGSAFFSAICKKGALLYDRNSVPFISPGPGKPTSQRIEKREAFWNKWHNLAQGFLQGAAFYQSIKSYNLAVYMLCQAVQHGYRGVLRVMVGYHVSGQSLRRLFRLVDAVVPHLSMPRLTPIDSQLLDILLKGHDEARYDDSFEVSEAQVAALADSVTRLVDTANTDCRRRIKQLKDGETAYA